MVAAILAAGFIVLGLPAIGYAAVVAKRRQRSRWLAAARAAGLEEIEPASGLWADGILTARAGPHEIRIEEYAHSRYNRGTRVVIDGNSGLTLRAEKDLTAVQRAIGPREIELGDEGFDHEVYVEGGDPPVLRAVLDLETRGLVRRFLDGLLRKTGEEGGGMVAATAAVHDGSVVFEVGSLADAALCDGFADLIQGPLELAHRLQRPASVVRRLVENTGCEPHARLRLENLKVLASTFPHHPAARELIERGCDDESQEVQLLCALALGVSDAKGRATLTEIATRGWSDDPLAARAIRALGATLDVPATSAILNRTLRTRSLETARACLQVLGENGSPPALDTLAKVLRVEQGELAIDAARALGAGGPAAEGPLVKALSAPDPDVRRAAVEALGTVGTSLAVLPLKEAAERDSGLRRAARQSIASIQSRLGAAPGQVSLAGSEAGTLALSDPDDAAGRLSMEKRSLD
jgi:hypothetical protein